MPLPIRVLGGQLKKRVQHSMRLKVVANSLAGRGRGAEAIPVIKRCLDASGVDYDMELTKSHGAAIDIARKAAQDGFDVVVACGGDGTINEVVNGIAGTPTKLGVIPAGTGNDFAIAMNVPTDPEEACRVILRGNSRHIDLCRVNGRYFINAFGTGFDAEVALEVNRGVKFLRGIWAYIFAVLKLLLRYRAHEAVITLDGKEIRMRPTIIGVTNAETYGGGMKICVGAKVDDGLFRVCLVDDLPKLKILWLLPKAIKGTHAGLKEVKLLDAARISIRTCRPQPYHIDGEVFEASLMDFEMVPGGIQVLC